MSTQQIQSTPIQNSGGKSYCSNKRLFQNKGTFGIESGMQRETCVSEDLREEDEFVSNTDTSFSLQATPDLRRLGEAKLQGLTLGKQNSINLKKTIVE